MSTNRNFDATDLDKISQHLAQMGEKGASPKEVMELETWGKKGHLGAAKQIKKNRNHPNRGRKPQLRAV